MKKQNRIRTAVAAAAGAVILLVGSFFATHTFIDGEVFFRWSEAYDLTAHELTPAQYEQICRKYPDVPVLWTVPFQGSRYPMDTESLTVTSLTREEADFLDYLPHLKQVDGTGCEDLAGLLYFRSRRPDCQVSYRVKVGGTDYGHLTQELTVTDGDVAELKQTLPLLPQLTKLNLEGTLPEPEEILELKGAFPEIALNYTVDIWGQRLPWDVEAIDLSAVEVSQQEMERFLPLFPELKELNLTETNLTDQELKALGHRFPDTFFRCTLEFAGKPFATDATEIDISGCPITVEETEALLPLFPYLEKLVMSYCGIDNEDMDAMNRRHPDTAIVWTVQIGIHAVRTDAYFFFPAGVDEAWMPNNEELKNLRYCTEMIAVDVGHTKATECEWLEYMPHLKYLILADTKITDLTPLSNLKELIYLELFIMDVVDYTPLLGCTALQDLNIGTTYGDPEPISKMTWLHHLQWNHGADNPEYHDAVLKLEEQLPDTVVIIDTWRNIGGPWRFLPHYYVFRSLIDGVYFNQISTSLYWGKDNMKILSCEKSRTRFAGDVLAEIVRYRIDNNLPIVGIKDSSGENAEELYQSLVEMGKYWRWRK